MFIICLIDISKISDKILPVLYADDFNLFIRGKLVKKVIDEMNMELSKVTEWLNCNKLSLNIEKTNYMVFTLQRNNPAANVVRINGHHILRVEKTKFLGVIIDSKLTWSDHINMVRNKIAKGFGIICKAKKVPKKSTLRTLYFCFVYPYLTYCVENWGRAATVYLDPIIILQKKILRVISEAPFRAHTPPLFLNLKIMPFQKHFLFQVLIFMYKVENHILPNQVCDMFIRNNEVHSYQTRNNECYRIPYMRLSTTQHSIRYLGSKLWNFYNNEIMLEQIRTIHKFRRILKRHLLNNDIPNI